ncbi:hypothetical protein [Aeromicrobium sp. UC242_57]|uniref:hypothetical protein n=1 Tax=Aeromicrobium sp. UC242_57 TaxID=3374624 RepID=UPI0037AF6D25
MASDEWMGETYGATTQAGTEAIDVAARLGLELEPVYTAKALGAIRSLGANLDGPVLFLQTHGPREG